jgi:hypothetical protein
VRRIHTAKACADLYPEGSLLTQAASEGSEGAEGIPGFSGDPERFGIGFFEAVPVTRGALVRDDDAVHGTQYAVKEHLFESAVIVEVLHMAKVGHRSGHLDVECRASPP